MPNNTKQQVLDDMVRSFKEYSRGNGRYDELDFKEDVLNLINSQVLEAIEKIKSKACPMSHKTYIQSFGTEIETDTSAVPLHAIEAIEKEYRNE